MHVGKDAAGRGGIFNYVERDLAEHGVSLRATSLVVVRMSLGLQVGLCATLAEGGVFVSA